jgi:putative membrane protein
LLVIGLVMGHPPNPQAIFAQLIIAGALCVATVANLDAQQVNNDPNNPNNSSQRGPANARAANAANAANPTLMEMGTGMDQGNIGPFVTLSDKQFARMTALRLMMEIQLSNAAMEKSDSDTVKQLSRRILDDYKKSHSTLERVSLRVGISLPSELDHKRKSRVEKISALSEPDFDRAYLKEMVRLHDRALTVTQYEAANAGVTAFRNWAGLLIPSIQDQLRMAKAAQK